MGTVETLTQRPSAFRLAGYQKWRNLLFVHWRADVPDVQRLLPARLAVDSFDGSAWVGIVAFDMHGVRPWWFLPIPGVSAFAETNLRTYVKLDGDEPGVWFFSLDAASSPAVWVARRRWHLNYHRSRMRLACNGHRVACSGRRLWPGRTNAAYTIEADLLEAAESTPAAPRGSLEEFLVERYVLYTQRADGMLLRAAVQHRPYLLRGGIVRHCEETLTSAAGIAVGSPPAHCAFSAGVDVRIGRLEGV